MWVVWKMCEKDKDHMVLPVGNAQVMFEIHTHFLNGEIYMTNLSEVCY